MVRYNTPFVYHLLFFFHHLKMFQAYAAHETRSHFFPSANLSVGSEDAARATYPGAGAQPIATKNYGESWGI